MVVKKTTLILIGFPLIALLALFGYYAKINQRADRVVNQAQVPLEFKDNTIQCPQCHMFLVGKKDTAQFVTAKGQTHFFDDIGCFILWQEEHKIPLEGGKLWVFSRDSKRYVDGFSAWYSLRDETPMQYGFAAYEQTQEGFIAYEQMRLRMLRGENLSDPRVRKILLGRY
jgi:copper chaperone NosL